MQNLPSYQLRPLTKASQAELERIEEVLRLLDNLFQREEATTKLIVDCLYDVGSIRLIEQKVPIEILHWPLKIIANLSKPVFRLFVLRWIKRNSPWLITCWLFNQVKFEGDPFPFEDDAMAVIDVAPTPEALLPRMEPLLEQQAAEINTLRDRVSWLTLAVIGLVALGCINMWRG